jgi:hypothetical protein
MKTSRHLIALFGAVSASVAGHDCSAQGVIWQPVTGEVEFGVTAIVGGTPIQSPSALESGYNGAWTFGNTPYRGMAQTFTVPSLRTLQSVQLRVGLFNYPATGQFELAICTFDSLSGTPSSKLASVLADAQNYEFDMLNVPVSSFDFASFNVSLNPAQTYALAVTPTATFAGTLALQAATDIYPGGEPYALSVVPEPSTVALCSLGTISFLVVGGARRRRI